jgi:hypothetical protein
MYDFWCISAEFVIGLASKINNVIVIASGFIYIRDKQRSHCL